MNKVYRHILLTAVYITLQACSGASSMQVTVDVYNGPLSKDELVQAQELIALAKSEACFSEDADATTLTESLQKKDLINIIRCGKDFVSKALHYFDHRIDAPDIPTTSHQCKSNHYTNKNQAAYCGSLGRELLARADVLYKQYDGESRYLFPLSAYLKDATSSVFNNSCVLKPELCLEKPGAENTYLTMRNRLSSANVTQSLLEDQYWTEINKVQASGAGKVRMAFIKDDIGNWSLKSFSNDASELIAAYNDFAVKAISTAATLTSGNLSNLSQAADKISSSEKIIQFSDRLAFGEATTLDDKTSKRYMDAVKAQIKAQLSQLKEEWLLDEAILSQKKTASNDKFKQSCNALNTDVPSETACLDTPSDYQKDIQQHLYSLATKTSIIQGKIETTSEVLSESEAQENTALAHLNNCNEEQSCADARARLNEEKTKTTKIRNNIANLNNELADSKNKYAEFNLKVKNFQTELSNLELLQQEEIDLSNQYNHKIDVIFQNYGELLTRLQTEKSTELEKIKSDR